MIVCCSKGCKRKAKLQLGWRAWPANNVITADGGSEPPLEAYSNQAVCRLHIPDKVTDYLPIIEIIRINAFLTERAHKPALDFEKATVITRALPKDQPAMPTVMAPINVRH